MENQMLTLLYIIRNFGQKSTCYNEYNRFNYNKREIYKGLELSRQRLITLKKKEGGELIFSKNGKIFRVPAKDLK
jgi:hypothetical protein